MIIKVLVNENAGNIIKNGCLTVEGIINGTNISMDSYVFDQDEFLNWDGIFNWEVYSRKDLNLLMNLIIHLSILLKVKLTEIEGCAKFDVKSFIRSYPNRGTVGFCDKLYRKGKRCC